jgi:hypothetical protein
MLESAKFEQRRLICQVEDQRKELELIQQSNQAYDGLSEKVTWLTSDNQKLQLDLNEAIAAMAEAEKSASACNRNSLAAVYETAAIESATRAAEAKTATAETAVRTAISRYQVALDELAGSSQSPNDMAIDAGDYGKVKEYLPHSFFIHINSFIRGRRKWKVVCPREGSIQYEAAKASSCWS